MHIYSVRDSELHCDGSKSLALPTQVNRVAVDWGEESIVGADMLRSLNVRINVRFKQSVSNNDDKPQGENDIDAPASKVVESCVVNEGVLECQTVDGASGCRRDFPLSMFFLFDVEELTFKPPKYERNNIISLASQDSDSVNENLRDQ